MSAFDVRTIIDLLAVGNLMAVVILLSYRNGSTRQQPYRMFMGGKVLQCLAWPLLGLRGQIPDFWSADIGNTLLFAGFALEAMAMATARQAVRYIRGVLGMVALVGTVVFWVFGSTPNLRVSIASFVSLTLFGTGAVVMLRHAKGSRLQWVMGLLYGFHAVMLMFRAAAPLLTKQEYSLMTQDPVQIMALLPVFFFMLVGGIGFLLLMKEHDDRRIRESEEKFATVFQSSPSAILLTRFQDGMLLEVNRSFETLTGYQASDVVGHTTTELQLWTSPELRAQLVERLSEGHVVGMEVEFRSQSGATMTGLLSAEVLVIHGEKVIVSNISDITARRKLEMEREGMIQELRAALSDVKALSGLLPICASCKKIRDDTGYWDQLEHYITEHSQADFTHGLCPDCARELFPEVFQKERSK